MPQKIPGVVKTPDLEQALREKDAIIEKLTKQDTLTGLPNWAATKAYLEGHLQQMRAPLGLLCMDFDNFKVFNLTYGYLLGDLLLAQFGERAKLCIPPEKGLLGRFNGDSFLAVLPNTTQGLLEEVSHALFAAVEELTVEVPNAPRVNAGLTICIGSTLWEGEAEVTTPYALLRQADLAMRKAKKTGRSQYVFHPLELCALGPDGQLEDQALRLAADIRGALERGEFEPFYQPLYSVQENLPILAEALVRWRHPQLGTLSPDRFLPLFEASGLIVKLDLYMFEYTCKNIRHWLDKGMTVLPIYCNFSRFHFLQQDFAGRLHAITEKHCVSPRYIGIEITENILVEDAQVIIQQMRELQNLGFTVAMDDFGSGYSSFGMLQELPVNVIKLDRIFFQRNLQDYRNTAIVCAITAIAKALGMLVISEGIETAQQVAFLKSIGCDVAQGFYYAKPMDRTAFEKLLCSGGGDIAKARLYSDAVCTFVERVLDAFFVAQDIGRFRAYTSEDVEWQDVFCTQALHGLPAVKAHFAKTIKGGRYSLIFRNITHHQDGPFLPISGEAVLVDEDVQPPYCRNFYFSLHCDHKGERLVLTQFHMDLIRAGSYVNLFRTRNVIKNDTAQHLDEQLALDPYYSMLPLGIIRYELTADMVITYMNDAMLDILGYTREQFWSELGGNLRQAVHPDDLDLIYQNSLRMIEGEAVAPFPYRFIRRDGSLATVLYQQCTVTADDDRPLVQSMYIRLDGLPQRHP